MTDSEPFAAPLYERSEPPADAAERQLAELRAYLANLASNLRSMSSPRESAGWTAMNELGKEIERHLTKTGQKMVAKSENSR